MAINGLLSFQLAWSLDNTSVDTSANVTQLDPFSQLVRYETVALHSVGQPQYYPGCLYILSVSLH